MPVTQTAILYSLSRALCVAAEKADIRTCTDLASQLTEHFPWWFKQSDDPFKQTPTSCGYNHSFEVLNDLTRNFYQAVCAKDKEQCVYCATQMAVNFPTWFIPPLSPSRQTVRILGECDTDTDETE